ncbi:DotA/TraY family protein [Marinimicrobium sp. ABcell2]|uniref:DotA/TraY family protein n=1 Tax=Marinimicrobium sp. ABcell2 TaxID=3069751 RepID=UPI0027AF9EDE|nr:DotA/TraY family protein [Marinimicrobium sp. ABcell2]MDQ2077524.1 DotA/TraY family protein [Marinimicrobium sp. ABcell2]
MTKRTPILLILAGIIVLAMAGATVNAQETGNEEPPRQLPHHLQTHAQAADQNLLIQIFGDVARAASGQMTLTDLVLRSEDGETGPMDTDSVLSGLMLIYLSFTMVIAGVLLVVLLVLMSIQASIEGKLLTQRYNEWAIIRTLYAVFAILPAAGGWSIGQYAILHATFSVNSVANEMHTFSNRWVFARGTVGSINMDQYHFRRVVEAAYLNEVCAATVNRYYELERERYSSVMETLMRRRANPNLSVSENLTDAIDTMTRALRSTDTAGGNDPYRVSLEARKHKMYQPPPPPRMQQTPALAEEQASAIQVDRLYSNYHWSSEKAGEGACGSIEVDYIGFTKGVTTTPNRRTLDAYFNAHDEAVNNLTQEISREVQTVAAAVWAVNDAIDPRLKQLRREELDALKEDERFLALAGLLETLAGTSIQALDELVDRKTAEYMNTVRQAYNRITAEQADVFDELILEIQRRQSSGSTANYLADIEVGSELNQLPEEYQGLADDSLIHLLENTRHGWLYSGFKWWDVSRATANTEALAAHRPVSNTFRDRIHYHPANLQETLSELDRKYTKAVTLRGYQGDKFSAEDVESAKQQASGMDYQEARGSTRKKYMNWFSGALFRAAFSDLERGDALMSLQRGGHRLLTLSGTVLTISSTMKILSAGSETGGGWLARTVTGGASETKGAMLGAVFEGIAKALMFLAFICLAVGILYAVYLPLLPAMIWTFGIIGWLEKLISLIIVLPIWMLGHFIPDGDGLINGVGRQGYILTASVLARPPVMVLSMHFAMVALEAVTGLLAHFYTVFIPNVHADYRSGLFVTMGSFVVFSAFLVIVAHMILNWTYKIPDDIGPILGGAAASFGEGEAKGQSQGVAGLMFHQTQGTSSLMGGAGGNHRPRMGRRGVLGKAAQARAGFGAR